MEDTQLMKTRRKKSGFTLVELLAVLVIMAIMMAVAVNIYRDLGRGAGMRSAVVKVQSSLSLARQWAVTHRTPTRWTAGNTSGSQRGYYVIATESNGTLTAVDAVNYLEEGIIFSATNCVQFRLDGSCYGPDKCGTWDAAGMRAYIVIEEANRGTNGMKTTSTVFRLTGRANTARD